MMDEWVFLGNADELSERLAPYVEAGVEHLVLADTTGLTCGPEEAQLMMNTQLPRLVKALKTMKPRRTRLRPEALAPIP
jgi:hypothetical protein